MLQHLNFDRDRLVLGTAGLAGIWGKVEIEESVQTIWICLRYMRVRLRESAIRSRLGGSQVDDGTVKENVNANANRHYW